MTCLLSGGFDSAVAAHKMMKRGAHLSFVHFWGGGARPGESSVHVARELVRRLVPWQFSAKLYLVPFEPVQREIVARAPEEFRILLYRRMMLRIAERIARSDRALGLITGDSLGQVASQTLHNMAAVGDAVRMPLYRPLAGDDKVEIMNPARKIGTSRHLRRTIPRLLPHLPAAQPRAALFARRIAAGRGRPRSRSAGPPGNRHHGYRALPLRRRPRRKSGVVQVRNGVRR